VKYVLLAVAALSLAACAKNIDTMEAVKQGVINDIPKDINLGGMDVNVVSVSFRGKEADAIVAFAPKGGPPMMNMKYTMERQGDVWRIKSRANASPDHAAQDPNNVAAPQGGQALPPGHPAPGAGGELPAGHPPLPKQ
jgi:hypothetical protein